jgi:hypothetical protein
VKFDGDHALFIVSKKRHIIAIISKFAVIVVKKSIESVIVIRYRHIDGEGVNY